MLTPEEIIKMARQTGLPSSDLYHENLEAFAKLVAERATAREHEFVLDLVFRLAPSDEDACEMVDKINEAIRARGVATLRGEQQ